MGILPEIGLWLAYVVPAMILMAFGCNLYFLLALFMRRRRGARREIDDLYREFNGGLEEAELPRVATQLPIYNEANVAERIIRSAAAMEYPAGRHIIQVLDDSNDGTCEIIDRVVADLCKAGHDITVIRRADRTGYKAGALNHGMNQTDAEFFAIFDADFVPTRDFLLRTMPIMIVREKVGLVQARWGHLNAGSSLVTRAQGMGIDGHFAIEQHARAWNDLFMNFNGTAGLWRRQAIDDAGGWEHDTLTEDMDLSYRAQLSGWDPYFLTDVVVPAEIPENINAFKSQQFRWAKGSIQTAIKLLPRVLRSPCSLLAKVQAVFHMTHYVIHPVMVWLALFALPLLVCTDLRTSPLMTTLLFGVILLSALAPLVLYAAAQIHLYPRGWRKFYALPILSSIGVGIGISNTRAVFEAITGKVTPFVRTPKKGDSNRVRYAVRMPYIALLELALGLYCFGSLWFYMHAQTYIVGPFLLLYAVGFTSVGVLSILHTYADARWLPGRIQIP
jgi:cellulose synthase/poly-beta-1,6-N-acetylglucosamine synthase-like glycosyltransferase